MRLLRRDKSGEFQFVDANERIFNVPYAILSHTWGPKEHEVLYQDIVDCSAASKPNCTKLNFALDQAAKDGLHHVWIDTCCINKFDLVELTEAINLMYLWYERSAVCYAYLSDVSGKKSTDVAESRWFTRGWTLQELVAPRDVFFYNQHGTEIGEKASMATELSSITGIRDEILRGRSPEIAPVAERFQWSDHRKTSRKEDMSHCLIGILGVRMSITYGIKQHEAHQNLMEAVAKEYGQSVVDEIKEAKAQMSKRHKLESSLAYRDTLMRKLRYPEAISKRTLEGRNFPGTCAWMVDHPLYKRWNNHSDQHTNLLWIQGHPGAGKSTLITYLYSKFMEASQHGTLTISYYFPVKGSEFERSTAGMYRSLVLQLLEQAPPSAFEGDKSHHEKASDKSEDHQLNVPSLKELLSDILSKCHDLNIRCFIDELDKCDAEETEDMVAFLADLAHLSSRSPQQFFVCFAGTYYPALSIKGSTHIRLEEQKQHQRELRSHVYAKLDTDRSVEADVIRQRLLEKSNGNFMWAKQTISLLNRRIGRGVMIDPDWIITQVPDEMSDHVDSIIKRIDPETSSTLRVCVSLLLCTWRPLTCEEFYHAVHLGIGDMNYTPLSVAKYDPQAKSEMLRSFVANASRGLAEQFIEWPSVVPDGCGIVRFMHESILHYFRQRDALKGSFAEVDAHDLYWCHDQVKISCYNYLKLYNTEIMQYLSMAENNAKGTGSRFGAENACIQKFPYLSYAAEHLKYHTDEAARSIPQEEFKESLNENVQNGRLDCLSRFRDLGVEDICFA